MKHFSIGILWRIFWLILSLCALLYFVPDEQWVLSAFMAFMSAIAVFQVILLHDEHQSKTGALF